MNLYAFLAVAETASESEIVEALLRLSSRFKQAAERGDKVAEIYMKQGGEAADILLNVERRKQYDASLANGRMAKPLERAQTSGVVTQASGSKVKTARRQGPRAQPPSRALIYGCFALIIITAFLVILPLMGPTALFAFLAISISFLVCAVVAIEFKQSRKAANDRRFLLESELRSIAGFSPTDQFIGCDLNTGIAFDKTSQKLCLLHGHGPHVVSGRDLISVELFQDGVSVTKTDRSSQIAGAVVGGVLFGTAGAMVGGLSGDEVTTKQVMSIDLRIVVNDTDRPLLDVAFYKRDGNGENMPYAEAIRMARKWNAIIAVLIKRNDAEEKSSQSAPRHDLLVQAAASVADEIRKLADLHSSGALTSEEFRQLKAKLVVSNPPAV